MANISLTNKLHVSWSDSTCFGWLNPTTVLDYFCNPNNPFYNQNCNNEILRMQNVNPEQLITMTGYEYQVYMAQPPIYIIRKVDRKSADKIIPISYYYILSGVVYQAPDFLSVISSRLQTASSHLQDALETLFSNYKYHPSKGYYWSFNQNEINRSESKLKTSTQFQRDRIDALLMEFTNRFPPTKQQTVQQQQQQQPAQQVPNQEASPQQQQQQQSQQQQSQQQQLLPQTQIKTETETGNQASNDLMQTGFSSGPPEKKIRMGR